MLYNPIIGAKLIQVLTLIFPSAPVIQGWTTACDWLEAPLLGHSHCHRFIESCPQGVLRTIRVVIQPESSGCRLRYHCIVSHTQLSDCHLVIVSMRQTDLIFVGCFQICFDILLQSSILFYKVVSHGTYSHKMYSKRTQLQISSALWMAAKWCVIELTMHVAFPTQTLWCGCLDSPLIRVHTAQISHYPQW